MSGQIILITGGNRGIGKGLVSHFLLRSNHIVIAAIRNLEDQSGRHLKSLPRATDSKLIVIKIDADSETDAAQAVHQLQTEEKITRIDILIANAGISKNFDQAIDVPASEVLEHFTVNTIGPLYLIQAFTPMLQSSRKPKFVALSTGLASIGGMGDLPLPFTAYGTSKAALNYIVRKIHFENEWLISFVISPGWVQTDMGNAGARANGMEQAPVTTKDSVEGIIGKINRAERNTASGEFLSFDEERYPW